MNRPLRASPLLALLVGLALPGAGAAQPRVLGEEPLGPEAPPVVRLAPAAVFEYSARMSVTSVALSPTGAYVAAVTRVSPEGPKAWDVGTRRRLQLPDLPGGVSAVAFGNEAGHFAAAVAGTGVDRGEPSIELHDLDGGPGPFLRGAGDASAIAWSPDDEVVVAALPEGIRGWDLREGASADLLRARGGAVTVSFTSAEELMVAAEGGALVMRVGLPGGEILDSWEGSAVDGPMAFSPDGSVLAVGAPGGLKLYDLRRGGAPQAVDLPSPATALAWASKGTALAAGTDGGEVHVFFAEVDPLPSGFSSTPKLNGRGGGVVGGWDARATGIDRDADRAIGGRDTADRDERDLRIDRDPLDRGRDLDLDRGRDADDERLSRRREDRQVGTREDREDRRLDLGRDREEREGPSSPFGRSGGAEAAPELSLKPRVLISEQLGGDPREQRDLEESLMESVKRLQPCWKQRRLGGDVKAGRVVFEMGITPNGEGVDIGRPIEDDIGSDKLVSCFQERLREPLFGPGLGTIQVRLELELTSAP